MNICNRLHCVECTMAEWDLPSDGSTASTFAMTNDQYFSFIYHNATSILLLPLTLSVCYTKLILAGVLNDREIKSTGNNEFVCVFWLVHVCSTVVKAVRASSSVQCAKSCSMHAEMRRTALWTSDSVIAASTAATRNVCQWAWKEKVCGVSLQFLCKAVLWDDWNLSF